MRIVKGRAEMPTSLRQLPENNKLDYDHEHSLAQMFSHLVWTVLHDQIDPTKGRQVFVGYVKRFTLIVVAQVPTNLQ